LEVIVANPFSKIHSLVVNDVTAGDQSSQIVLTSPTGDVLVLWYQGFGQAARLQIFDSDGVEVSPEILFSAALLPIATWLADGSFAVLDRSGGQTIVSQYSRTGTLLASSPDLGFPVTNVEQIIQLDNGNIVVTSTVSSGGELAVTGQLLDSALQPVGTSFAISADGPPQRLEALAGGGFFSFTTGVFATESAVQLFAADGTMMGDPIVMDGKLMTAAALPDGGFVLTVSRINIDGNSWGIVARIFEADGTPRTDEFIANTITEGDQSYSSVAVVDDDLFVVTWGGFNSRAQLFDMNGRKIGSEILLENGAGFDGSRYAPYGWTIDGSADPGFVAASASSNDITLSYWEVNRDNVLLGDSSAESFDGGGAAERIMVGYGGDDTYHVDSAADEVQELAGEGNDTLLVTLGYRLGTGAEIELLATENDAGTAAINLTGNAFAQTIRGNAGANQLTGDGGGDVLIGLGGNDIYVVGNTGDVVQEAVGGGTDRIFTTVDYVLAAGVEVETLTTDLHASTVTRNLTGNAFVQGIYGNAGVNQLNGGGGADTLVGFAGDDSYVIVDGGESVFENAGEGTDRIFAAVDYRLRAGVSVETLSTDFDAGTAAIDLTGNELVQLLRGNAGANILDGGGGKDVMIGLGGDDFYYVDHGADVVQEAGGGGTDRVFASNSYTLTAGAEVEKLTTSNNAGTAAIDLHGNALAQGIYGNAGANQLNGGGGADDLVGFGGDDWYFIVSGLERVFEAAAGGADRIFAAVDYRLNAGAQVELISTEYHPGTSAIDLTGNEFAQTVYGNAGANILDGGAGKDVLVGNAGADIYLFSTALNTVSGAFAALAASANVDRIDSFAFDDRIGLDATRFGLTPGALPAGAFALGTTATEADDRIIYDQATGALRFDADGSGAGAAQLFAYLNGPFSLDASYFVVI
jgi:Ca2+-binding RTX toxin-like protein